MNSVNSDDHQLDSILFERRPAIVVTGPTAGGKSGLSARLADHFGWVTISLDSMKVYRQMNIGSAKPNPEQRAKRPYHMLDIRDPWQGFSVGDYVEELAAIGPRLEEPWFFSGGTAFYLNSLLKGIFKGPAPDLALRAKLEAEAQENGLSALYSRLHCLDPVAAANIQPTDLRRTVRALEVMEHCDELFSELQKRRRPILPEAQTRVIGIARTRAELYKRIDERVLQMFDQGWVEEVQSLIDAHDPAWSPQANQSIGYALIRKALNSGEDPRQQLELIQTKTRQFARHQLIWLRKLPVEWWHPDEESQLVERIEQDLQHYQKHGKLTEQQTNRKTYQDM